jgi:hypothetical protein
MPPPSPPRSPPVPAPASPRQPIGEETAPVPANVGYPAPVGFPTGMRGGASDERMCARGAAPVTRGCGARGAGDEVMRRDAGDEQLQNDAPMRAMSSLPMWATPCLCVQTTKTDAVSEPARSGDGRSATASARCPVSLARFGEL